MNITITYYHPVEFAPGHSGVAEYFTKVENFGITKDDYFWIKHHGVSETRPMLGIRNVKIDMEKPFNWEAEHGAEGIQPASGT